MLLGFPKDSGESLDTRSKQDLTSRFDQSVLISLYGGDEVA